MVCTKCGNEIVLDAEFLYNSEYSCPKCGNIIKSTSVKKEQRAREDIEDKNLWEYFLGCFQKYAVFSGRARRKEYWSFYLFYSIFGIVVSILDSIIFNIQYEDYGIISIIWSLLTLIPYLSVCVRRYHDCDKRGWVIFIPIYNLVMLFFDGTYGENRFGDEPKGRADI